MRVLVLGNSDTAGEFSPGTTWPFLAAAKATAATAAELTVSESRFSATRPDAAAFAARAAEDAGAEVVILPLGTFACTVGFTWVRVQRFFGKRVADWYRRGEGALDRRTRGESKLPNFAGRTLRRLMRRVVGTEPVVTWRSLADNYGQVLRMLARVEGLDVLLVAYPPERGGPPIVADAAGRREQFLAAVAAEAAAHRFTLVDSARAYLTAPDPDALFTPDGFHSTLAGHAVLADVVAAGLVAVVGARSAD